MDCELTSSEIDLGLPHSLEYLYWEMMDYILLYSWENMLIRNVLALHFTIFTVLFVY
jgi:hypothetical protein